MLKRRRGRKGMGESWEGAGEEICVTKRTRCYESSEWAVCLSLTLLLMNSRYADIQVYMFNSQKCIYSFSNLWRCNLFTASRRKL